MRRKALSRAMVVLALAAPAGCGSKTQKAAPAKPAKPVAASPTGSPARPKPAASKTDRTSLARVFALSRCVLIGVLAPNVGYYTSNGFADDAAFRARFQAAATADPIWARGVVTQATNAPCRGLVAKPEAPTTPPVAPEKTP